MLAGAPIKLTIQHIQAWRKSSQIQQTDAMLRDSYVLKGNHVSPFEVYCSYDPCCCLSLSFEERVQQIWKCAVECWYSLRSILVSNRNVERNHCHVNKAVKRRIDRCVA